MAIVFALAMVTVGVPAQASADTGVTVFPGMEIHQGGTTCTLGFVEVGLRIALTTSQCDDGSIVTDSHANVVGTVLMSRRNTADGAAADSPTAGVEYEVITLAANVTATDTLPIGRTLQSTPSLRAQTSLPVCHFGISTGQTCGRVGSVGDNRFAISDVSTDKRDNGGPVYTLTDNNRATMVGLFDATSKSAAQAQTWQAVMEQLYLDLRSPNAAQLPPGVHVAGTRIQRR